MANYSNTVRALKHVTGFFSIGALRWKLKKLVLVIGILTGGVPTCSVLASSNVQEEKKLYPSATSLVKFDMETLKQRGIDPKVAEYFSKAPRFVQGVRRVTVTVNGTSRGIVEAHFDAEGQLCFDRTLLDQANLKVPETYLIGTDGKTGSECYDFIKAFPQTELELRPGHEEINLVVSTEALRPLSEDEGVYQRGGTAGLLNYELIGQQSQSSRTTSRYSSANTELGFNSGDWLVRSRQIFAEQDGRRNFQSLYTFAQKTFISSQSMLQAGQINISNSVFPGASISGLQVMPDSALQGGTSGGVAVNGIAQSQARVEIRQAGALIYTTLVPAGPFHLTNIQLLNGNTDLDVHVIEASGEQHNFIVTAASLTQYTYTAPGYSMAVGKVRTFGASEMQSPAVVTGTGGWLLSPRHKLSAGLMLGGNQYQANAFTLDSAVTANTSISLRATAASAGKEGVRGGEGSIAINSLLTRNLSASMNITRASEGFRNLLDSTFTAQNNSIRGLSKEQYGASLNWTDSVLGGFGLGYTTSSSFDGRTREYLTSSWGRTFKYFTVSANLERSMGRRGLSNNDQRDVGFSNDISGNAMYLSVSIPLGNNRSVHTYANKRSGRTRFGSSVNDSSSDVVQYQISAESNTDDREKYFSGNVNTLPRYTSLNLGYTQSGNDSSSYSGQVSGGMVLHEHGLTLSPYKLNDTFAVAKVGDMSGIKLSTPSGPVWTDPWGRAVVSQLSAYRSSSVEVVTKTLPRNVDIQNGFKAISAGRGSVNEMDFSVFRTRRVLLKVKDNNGSFLPKGASVFGAEEQFITSVVDGGKIFLSNEQLSDQLRIRLDDGKICTLSYTLPDKADPNVYFESADASCKFL